MGIQYHVDITKEGTSNDLLEHARDTIDSLTTIMEEWADVLTEIGKEDTDKATDVSECVEALKACTEKIGEVQPRLDELAELKADEMAKKLIWTGYKHKNKGYPDGATKLARLADAQNAINALLTHLGNVSEAASAEVDKAEGSDEYQELKDIVDEAVAILQEFVEKVGEIEFPKSRG